MQKHSPYQENSRDQEHKVGDGARALRRCDLQLDLDRMHSLHRASPKLSSTLLWGRQPRCRYWWFWGCSQHTIVILQFPSHHRLSGIFVDTMGRQDLEAYMLWTYGAFLASHVWLAIIRARFPEHLKIDTSFAMQHSGISAEMCRECAGFLSITTEHNVWYDIVYYHT